MTKVLVTYGTSAYVPAMELLRHTAMTNGGFDKVVVYDQTIIQERVGDERHGSYAWKAAALLRAMRLECRDGDLLAWADSTIAFNAWPFEECRAVLNFFEIGDAAEKGYTIGSYTKPSCLAHMKVNGAEMEAFQVNAAIQVYRKCPEALAFLQTYHHLSQIPDCVGHDTNSPLHRHDQSILSILARRQPSAVIHPDPTQYGMSGKTGSPIDHHRKILKPMQTLVVVTPTTGSDLVALRRCMDSVQQQDIICLRHMIVCDGPEASATTEPLRRAYRHLKVPVAWFDLPYNTGRNRWNGHRIYGAAPFLAQAAHVDGPAQLIAFLDEDNWYSPTHLQQLLDKLISEKLDAVHSLRKIWDRSGFVCDDSCESLGQIAPCSAGNYFLGDTSTWLIRHATAVDAARCWNVRARDPTRPEADQALTKYLLKSAAVGTVRQHSLNYSASSGPLSVSPAYFTHANSIDKWDFVTKPDLYLFHMSPEHTNSFFKQHLDTSRSYLLDEWNMGQGRALHQHFNLINGYACLPHIPQKATVLVHMCLPDQLPLTFLKDRTDLRRLLYTAESPNIRHRAQWQMQFLSSIADDILTYWKPLLSTSASFRSHFCPHNCHHFDSANPHDRLQLLQNRGEPGTICMVLENRSGLEAYEINGVRLSCLDGMRRQWATRLAELDDISVTVHGKGWEANGAWTVQHSSGKFTDERHAVQILSSHSAALIVENCDAEGYVSEKIYDAFMAGAVPIFYNGHEVDFPFTDDVYFNLATCSISSITPQRITEKRAAVYRLRHQMLEAVGAQAYADTVKAVLH